MIQPISDRINNKYHPFQEENIGGFPSSVELFSFFITAAKAYEICKYSNGTGDSCR